MTAQDSRWSSRSLGSRFQHNIFLWLVRCRALPLARALLAVVVFYYTLLPHVRRRCMPYVRRRFGACRGGRAFVHAYRLYLSFGGVLLDRMTAGATGRFPLPRHATEARRLLRQILDRGHGCLLLTAHVGAWQLGMAALETTDAPVSMLQWRDPGDVDRHYFEAGHGKPVQIIDASRPLEAMVQVTAALRQGHLVALMGDRHLDALALGGQEPTVTVPFLGAKAALPIKAYALASATGAPLVMVLTVRDGGRTRPFLCEEITIPGGLNHRRPEQFAPYARRFAAALETFIDTYPYQFFNFHNLWLDEHDDTGTARSPQTDSSERPATGRRESSGH